MILKRLVLFFAVASLAQTTGITKVPLGPSARHFSPADSSHYPYSLLHPSPAYLDLKTQNLQRRVLIDFERRQVELVLVYRDRLTPEIFTPEDSAIAGVVLWRYEFAELDDYLRYYAGRQFSEGWRTGSPLFNLAENTRKPLNLLDIQIPVKLPAWARRVVGSEGPRLTIRGMFKISLGGNSTWETGSQNINNQRQGFPDITVNQEMNFTVTGKIGRLINVEISTDNTQDLSDQLKKQMKIHYKGETEQELEDEIVQEVEAGYTNFSMPNAEFDGYSETHEGLFGIKVRMKLGDLQLTTILSQEEGQADKKSFSPRQDRKTTITQDREIEYDRVFFLDSNYYHAYYPGFFGPVQPVPQVTKAYLLRKESGNNPTRDAFLQSTSSWPDLRLVGDGLYKVLKPSGLDDESGEFYLDPRGFVILRSAIVNKDEQLLAYFVRADKKTSESLMEPYKFGTTVDTTTVDGNRIVPYVLRPLQPSKENPQWVLSWKNIYRLGDIPLESRNDVTVEVKYKEEQTQLFRNTYPNETAPLSDLFGLTDKGVAATKNPDIFMFEEGLIAFPPSTGPTPFNNPGVVKDQNLLNPAIYDNLAQDQTNNSVSNRFQIEVTAVSINPSFSLGAINILEGSEVVRLGGQTLVRDQDYLIQYDVGQLSLISERALNAMDQVTVEFEYAPFFIPEEKTFFAARAEYKLPRVGKESFVAASFMRKSETSQERRSQLGREPSTNMIVDVNSKLNFEPAWMTAAVNKVPGIQSDEKSAVTLSAEYAHSIVDPNTNERDEALLDDFEDSKTTFSLPVNDLNWYWASPPDTSVLPYPFQPLQTWGGHERQTGPLSDVGWFGWYSRDTLQNSIWEKSTNAQARWRMLELRMRPHGRMAPGGTTADSVALLENSWGGIMSPLGLGITGQLENAQYLEVWLKVVQGDAGKLHVDLGQMSEDLRIAKRDPSDLNDSTSEVVVNADPDFHFNDEWYRFDRKYMSVETDLGLDMRTDDYEAMVIPTACDSIDSLGNPVFCPDTVRQGAGVTDPAGDNFDWTVNSDDFSAFNGTQSNGTSEPFDTRKQYDPDNEDVFTDNGRADLTNKYHHYEIDLSKADSSGEPYLVETNSTGWKFYRIPLLRAKSDSAKFQVGGTARLVDARGLRLWWTGLDRDSRLQIAKMEIVGSKWISRDTATYLKAADTTQPKLPAKKKFDVAVVNTIDNRGVYQRPDFVPNFFDRDRQVEVSEQSLLLKYDSLSLREPEVKAVRFYQLGLDFRLYQKLKLYYQMVQKTKNGSPGPGNEVSFFLRFGSDSAQYYEYRISPPLRQGTKEEWDSLTIDLNALAELKQRELERLRATGDSAKVRIGSGNLRVLGSPTFADIRWLAVGFLVDTANPLIDSADVFSGRIWLNDLKLVDPQSLSGNAARVNLTTKFADFLDLNSSVYYRDGSFLKLTEKWGGGGLSEMSMDVNSTVKLNKFTPGRWGLSVPLLLGVKSTVRRPRYVPQSDVYLSDDGLGDMAPDAFNLVTHTALLESDATKAERYESTNVFKSASSSYSKGTPSDNLFVNLTADRVKTAGGISVSDDKSVTELSTTTSYNNNVEYSASPAQERTYVPFKNAQTPFARDHFADIKLYYFPRTLNFKIYDARYSRLEKLNRPSPDAVPRPLSPVYTFSLTHSYDLQLPVIEWKHLKLDFSHTNSVDRNLNDFILKNRGFDGDIVSQYILRYDPQWRLQDGTGPLPRAFVLHGETGNNQNFTYNLDPAVVSFLEHNFNYSSNYSHRLNFRQVEKRNVNYLDLDAKTNLGAHVNLLFVSALESAGGLFGPGAKNYFDRVKKGFEYFNFTRIGFNYTVDVSRKTSYLSRVPLTPWEFLSFRAGAFGRNPVNLFTGEDDERLFGGWKYPETPRARETYVQGFGGASTNDGRDVSFSASTNAGITLPFLLNLSLNSDLRYARRYAEKVGYRTVDTSVTWPNVNVNGSISNFMPVVRKIPFLGERSNSASFNSGFSVERTVDQKFDRDTEDIHWKITTLKWGLSPVYKLTVGLKNQVSLTNGTDWSSAKTVSTEQKSNNDGKHSFGIKNNTKVTYTLSKNRALKLLFWDLTLNNQMDLFAAYDYFMDWSYQWPVHVGSALYLDYADYYQKEKKEDPTHFEKKKTYHLTSGFDYNITQKMKSGASFGWKRELTVLPGNDDSNEDNKRKYDILINLWVQWNF